LVTLFLVIGVLAHVFGPNGASPRVFSVRALRSMVPLTAGAFHDSVGVNTHAFDLDTAYAAWPRLVAALDELGVKHLRGGAVANPAPQWSAINEHFDNTVELAASHGMRFDLGIGEPGLKAGTIEQLIGVVGAACAMLSTPSRSRMSLIISRV
jgi:hypothetical protein